MFDCIIQQNNGNNFLSLISFGADMCILGITLYTTWKTFFERKIKLLSYTPHFNMFGGDYISIVVENTSLSPISINKIDILCGDYSINMCHYNEPFILEPQKATKINMEPFSTINEISLDKLVTPNVCIKFATSKGSIITSFAKLHIKYDKKKKYKTANVFRSTFNGYVITPDIKYVILTKYNDKEQTIFINDKGRMNMDLYGYNAIPLSDVNNIEIVRTHIQNVINKYNTEQKFCIEPIKNLFAK